MHSPKKLLMKIGTAAIATILLVSGQNSAPATGLAGEKSQAPLVTEWATDRMEDQAFFKKGPPKRREIISRTA